MISSASKLTPRPDLRLRLHRGFRQPAAAGVDDLDGVAGCSRPRPARPNLRKSTVAAEQRALLPASMVGCVAMAGILRCRLQPLGGNTVDSGPTHASKAQRRRIVIAAGACAIGGGTLFLTQQHNAAKSWPHGDPVAVDLEKAAEATADGRMAGQAGLGAAPQPARHRRARAERRQLADPAWTIRCSRLAAAALRALRPGFSSPSAQAPSGLRRPSTGTTSSARATPPSTTSPAASIASVRRRPTW